MNTPSKVKIKAVKGKYHFFVNNKLFEIKGVNGGRDVALLFKSGATSFRGGASKQYLIQPINTI